MTPAALQTLAVVTNLALVLALGWYLILNLQWYSYKLERVVLNHHKRSWHLFYFVTPFLAYFILGEFFPPFFLLYLGAFIWWYRRLDKKLVLTWRVKRFLILLGALALFGDFLCLIKSCGMLPLFLPLLLAWLLSTGIEKFLFLAYKREAQRKLARLENLTVVAVTGSYGKTSMKNFIAQLLGTQFEVYMTPRSVNTLGGIIKDINEALPETARVYVCEAGARRPGDILEIAQLVAPHYAVVGKVGPQHLEYFGDLETIVRTKLELIQSPRLKAAFVHYEATEEPHEKVRFFGAEIENIAADLEGTAFDLALGGAHLHLHAPVLGGFNAVNIEAAVLIGRAMGMQDDAIIRGVEALKPVEHRLQRIDAGGKIILDDGYNGNIDGMKEGIRLCALHPGRKVIVTPGLVESTEALNRELIEAINGVFNLVIVTGKLNAAQFKAELTIADAVYLEEKSTLTSVLAEKTRPGDIIYFANDAPNFI
ncbi:UDP-N-acetylmuramoyl-tripeptide--D-alanyl-D-alanine ligase [Sulfurimonas sp. HSL1-2]|uniref:UDP-N-acetylmuramoyl-tripeptide--D-alanyl-D- alanine ligase n=1 Tax=Thiomicrolovo zhangzhouensis TaxID=3131933 RepID=UPI0031F88017